MAKHRDLNERIPNSSGADPEFPVGGGANPPGGGANIQIFPKNCMKLRTFWFIGGGGGARAGGAPLDPPLFMYHNFRQIYWILFIPLYLGNSYYKWRIQDFLDGGASNHEFGVETYYMARFFCRNCMKMKEIGRGGGRGSRRPWHSSPWIRPSFSWHTERMSKLLCFPCLVIKMPKINRY